MFLDYRIFNIINYDYFIDMNIIKLVKIIE